MAKKLTLEILSRMVVDEVPGLSDCRLEKRSSCIYWYVVEGGKIRTGIFNAHVNELEDDQDREEFFDSIHIDLAQYNAKG